MTQSIDIPDDIMNAARSEAERRACSVADQIAHWVRVGRAVERSGDFNYARVAAALAGTLSPEDLSDLENAVYAEETCRTVGRPTEEEEAFFAAKRERSPSER